MASSLLLIMVYMQQVFKPRLEHNLKNRINGSRGRTSGTRFVEAIFAASKDFSALLSGGLHQRFFQDALQLLCSKYLWSISMPALMQYSLS
jgi:hypothetical protein